MDGENTGSGQDVGIIEKAFLMGLGAAVVAKEKVEELAEELIKRGTITREQSDSFVNRLASQAEEAGKSAQSAVSRGTEQAITGVGLASARDLETLREELTEIKGLIASMRPFGTEAAAGEQAGVAEDDTES